MGRQKKDLGYIYFGLYILSILKWWYLPLSDDDKKLGTDSYVGRMLLQVKNTKTPYIFSMYIYTSSSDAEFLYIFCKKEQ